MTNEQRLDFAFLEIKARSIKRKQFVFCIAIIVILTALLSPQPYGFIGLAIALFTLYIAFFAILIWRIIRSLYSFCKNKLQPIQ